jgi:hypothetical protein
MDASGEKHRILLKFFWYGNCQYTQQNLHSIICRMLMLGESKDFTGVLYMKHIFLSYLAVGVIVSGFFGTASALTMTDVGGTADTLIAQTNLINSGDAEELAWVNSVLGGGYTLEFKVNTTSSNWEAIVDATGIYAYEATEEPDYFLVKTGSNSGNTNKWFLFDNIGSLNWAVISLVDMGFSEINIANIDKISHIDGFGDNQPVPEPASMVLMALGIGGILAIIRIRRNIS